MPVKAQSDFKEALHMSTRFLSNVALALAAGFLVVATMAFAPGTVAWISFGIAIAIAVTGLAMLPSRSPIQRIVSGLVTLVGAWTIVASLVFAPATVVWLAFASALAVVGLSVVGLTAHELRTERVVHSLEIEREPVAA
jgi:FtsH-binding integral membrane protein